MKTQWTLQVTYGLTPFSLLAELEYHSTQIMRIRVFGKRSSLLLENNYPLLLSRNSKKGIQWKIKEGSLADGSEKNSRLLLHIMEQLEHLIKKDFSGGVE